MEWSRSHQIKVGLFVVIGSFITLFSIFLLSGNRSLFGNSKILYAKFDQVQGLAAGSVVSLSGIVVGNIRTIEFTDDSKLRIVMQVNGDHFDRIKEGSFVEVRTQGALGDKFLYITPGPLENPTVKEGAVLDSAKASDLMGIIAEKGPEANKVFEIINEVHKLTRTFNEGGRTEKILNNLVEASNNFKSASADGKILISEWRGEFGKEKMSKLTTSFDKLDKILSKIDRGEGTLGALVNDPTLHESLKSALGVNQRRKTMKTIIRSSIEKSSATATDTNSNSSGSGNSSGSNGNE
jgi:phospholipid/cholesterol/gamma-HCH transport system substrate-binding protein